MAALSPNVVDLWLFDLADRAWGFFTEPELDRILSPKEKARAALFANPSSASDYRLSMGLIRHALARNLKTTPDCIAFSRDAQGKPTVAGAGIFISYSHTVGFTALSVSQRAAVGVDAECVRDFPPDREILTTLEIIFETLTGIFGESGADLDHRNTQGWTILEAITKAHGRPLESLFSTSGRMWLRGILSESRDFSLFFRKPLPKVQVSLFVRSAMADLQQQQFN